MSYKFVKNIGRNHSSRSSYGYGSGIVGITIHHWGSDGQKHANVVSWLRGYTGNRGSSAHYVVSDGLVTQIVEDSRASWHGGNNKANGTTIGIECRPEMSAGDWATLVELCVNLERKHGSMKYYGHKDWKNTACPGDYYPRLSELVDAVNEYKKSGKVPSTTGGGSSSGGSGKREYETVDYGITLGLWDKGDPVKDWQDFLVSQGYDIGDGGVDGYFGADTEKPTKAFQEKHGLVPDGLAGDKTIDKAEELGLKWTRKPKKSANPKANQITVDGKWGRATTRRLQEELGTPVDGEVSFQPIAYKTQNPGLLSGWEWTSNPRSSNVIEALQGKLGVTKDGRIGPQTIGALQRKLGTIPDGYVSNPSVMVRKLQDNLNAGKLW
ncbi:peptidoglycan recognition protein family protein [Brevibacterium sp. VCM10]|uniref:peptidoglycan recognition protein family protein n=1 Tax=Brevibacterium sp. VCM10 TaxID=1381751 RepID=UPI0004BCB229|nr:peptidoglycan-binding protein [Brevibacterium sp. VCM10]